MLAHQNGRIRAERAKIGPVLRCGFVSHC
jgi:hypothetical protein